MKPSYLIILLVLNCCWAVVFSACKVLAPELSTGGIVTLRFGLAALCLLLAWPWLPGPAPQGRDLVRTCLLGLLVFAVGQRLVVYGNELGNAGNSAVLVALEPLVTTVAAAIFLREHLGPRRLAGFVLGLFGVILLNGVWLPGFRWSGLGPSLVFVSSFFCEAAYSVAGKPILARASPMKMVAISLLAGTAGNLLIDGPSTLAALPKLTANAWLLLLYMAIPCTAFGYCVWFVIIRECPVNVAALTVFAQAAFGVVVAAVWLKEPLHWGQLWGSVAIVAGLLLGLSRQITKPSATV